MWYGVDASSCFSPLLASWNMVPSCIWPDSISHLRQLRKRHRVPCKLLGVPSCVADRRRLCWWELVDLVVGVCRGGEGSVVCAGGSSTGWTEAGASWLALAMASCILTVRWTPPTGGAVCSKDHHPRGTWAMEVCCDCIRCPTAVSLKALLAGCLPATVNTQITNRYSLGRM